MLRNKSTYTHTHTHIHTHTVNQMKKDRVWGTFYYFIATLTCSLTHSHTHTHTHTHSLTHSLTEAVDGRLGFGREGTALAVEELQVARATGTGGGHDFV